MHKIYIAPSDLTRGARSLSSFIDPELPLIWVSTTETGVIMRAGDGDLWAEVEIQVRDGPLKEGQRGERWATGLRALDSGTLGSATPTLVRLPAKVIHGVAWLGPDTPDMNGPNVQRMTLPVALLKRVAEFACSDPDAQSHFKALHFTSEGIAASNGYAIYRTAARRVSGSGTYTLPRSAIDAIRRVNDNVVYIDFDGPWARVRGVPRGRGKLFPVNIYCRTAPEMDISQPLVTGRALGDKRHFELTLTEPLEGFYDCWNSPGVILTSRGILTGSGLVPWNRRFSEEPATSDSAFVCISECLINKVVELYRPMQIRWDPSFGVVVTYEGVESAIALLYSKRVHSEDSVQAMVADAMQLS